MPQLTFAGVAAWRRAGGARAPPRPTRTGALVRRGSAESLPSGAISDRYLEPLAHETLLVRRGRRSGLFTMAAVHSTARGPALGGGRQRAHAGAATGGGGAVRPAPALNV